jgi:hypothetical protein
MRRRTWVFEILDVFFDVAVWAVFELIGELF